MDNTQNTNQENKAQESKTQKITTTVTCPHCGKQHEVTVEVPEQEKAPQLFWQG